MTRAARKRVENEYSIGAVAREAYGVVREL